MLVSTTGKSSFTLAKAHDHALMTLVDSAKLLNEIKVCSCAHCGLKAAETDLFASEVIITFSYYILYYT